jgi:hypothetical protein
VVSFRGRTATDTIRVMQLFSNRIWDDRGTVKFRTEEIYFYPVCSVVVMVNEREESSVVGSNRYVW